MRIGNVIFINVSFVHVKYLHALNATHMQIQYHTIFITEQAVYSQWERK